MTIKGGSRAKPEVPCRVDRLVEYPLGDESLLYGDSTDTAFALNPTAKSILDLCDGKKNVDEIVSTLAARYSIDPAELKDDIGKAILQLEELDLIRMG